MGVSTLEVLACCIRRVAGCISGCGMWVVGYNEHLQGPGARENMAAPHSFNIHAALYRLCFWRDLVDKSVSGDLRGPILTINVTNNVVFNSPIIAQHFVNNTACLRRDWSAQNSENDPQMTLE